MRKKWMTHGIALIGLVVFSVLGLGSARTAPAVVAAPGVVEIARVPWSAYTLIPNKNYTVIGTVVLRNVNPATLLGDLMDQAVAMGGHDIKNVRLAVTGSGENQQITVATAVVIRYTDETLEITTDGMRTVGGGGVDGFTMTEIEVVEAVTIPEARPMRIWPFFLGAFGILAVGSFIL